MSNILRPEELPAGSVTFSLADFEHEARDIVRLAKERAAEIEADALLNAEAITEEARKTGFGSGHIEGLRVGDEEGRKAGREAGLSACREATATLAAGLESMAAELASRRATLLKEAERDLLDLAIRIAERIVRREISADKQAAGRALLEAVSLVAERSRITVRVNPADRSAVEEVHAELHRRFAEIEDLQLVGDEAVERGGCRVVTATGEVDMEVATQIERIRRLLTGEADDQGSRAEEPGAGAEPPAGGGEGGA